MHVGQIKLPFLLLTFLLLNFNVLADEISEIDEILEEYFQFDSDEMEIDENGGNAESGEENSLKSELENLLENPIDINNIEIGINSELEQISFLKGVKAEKISDYLYTFGEIYTIHEFDLIDSLDEKTVFLLKKIVKIEPKVKIKQINFKEAFLKGKSELYLRADGGFEKKNGFKRTKEELAENPKKYYLGDPIYTSLKYRFHYKDELQIGFTAEKDAGEQFWGKWNKGYDFYSGYFNVKNFWKFKNLILGDYRAVFGQGLVMRSEFRMRDAQTTVSSPKNSGFRKHSSTDEFNFLRGVAAEFKVNNFNFSPFYSVRKYDADTVGGDFSTIKIDGLHRTVNEFEKRKTVWGQAFGANATYRSEKFLVGLTSATTVFGGEKWSSALSFDYRAKVKRFNFYGENAISTGKGFAFFNNVNFSPNSLVEILLSHRYYSPNYEAFYAGGFGEKVKNEHGIYLGLRLEPLRKWRFSFSGDAYENPAPTFANRLAGGQNYRFLARTEFLPASNVNLKLQYTFKFVEKSHSQNKLVEVENVKTNRLIFSALYRILNIKLKSSLGASSASERQEKPTFGYFILQEAWYKIPKIGLEMNARYTYFDAQNYANRFAVYESDIPQVFATPQLYGQGCRYYLNIGYRFLTYFSVWVKFSQFYYTDSRERISSDLSEISGNRKTDWRILVRGRW